MKFAMIVDAVGGGLTSYQVKNGKSYDLDGNPTNFDKIMISNEFAISMWNYPWLYEDGYFIHWKQHMDNLPKVDLDVIFLAIEKCLLEPEHTVSKIRKQYPNAKIIGWIKELWLGAPYDYENIKYKARLNFLNECDAIAINRPQPKEFQDIESKLNKKLNFVAIPVNTNYLHDNFFKKKYLALYAYIPNPLDRRGTTYAFTEHISKKFNIPVKYKVLSNNLPFDYLSQEELITSWSSCAFHLNLDPIDYFPGNQCALVAATGTINIGGVNDYHHTLYPKTATCDWEVLEKEMDSYINNSEARDEVIKYAWKQLNNIFSFQAVRKQIESIL
jgi:hypothetical protein